MTSGVYALVIGRHALRSGVWFPWTNLLTIPNSPSRDHRWPISLARKSMKRGGVWAREDLTVTIARMTSTLLRSQWLHDPPVQMRGRFLRTYEETEQYQRHLDAVTDYIYAHRRRPQPGDSRARLRVLPYHWLPHLPGGARGRAGRSSRTPSPPGAGGRHAHRDLAGR